MKYTYKILLELEAKEKNTGERLQKYAELISKDAVKHFNEKAAKQRKPKEIKAVDVRDYEVLIELDSSEELEAPFKSMRSYSQFLMNNGMDKLADGNALFRSVKIDLDVNEMTDERMLNILLHMVMRRNKKDMEFIDEVKKLIEDKVGDVYG